MGSTAIRIVNILLREVYFTPLSFVFPSFLRYGYSIIRVFVGAGFFSIKKKMRGVSFPSVLCTAPHIVPWSFSSRLHLSVDQTHAGLSAGRNHILCTAESFLVLGVVCITTTLSYSIQKMVFSLLQIRAFSTKASMNFRIENAWDLHI